MCDSETSQQHDRDADTRSGLTVLVMADLFDGYPRGTPGTRCSTAEGAPARVRRGARGAAAAVRSRSARARRRAGQQLPRPGRHVRLRGRGAAVPARPRPAGHRGDEWELLEHGVAQRVRALEAFLADVYGTARVLADGVVPRSRDRDRPPLPPRGRRASSRRTACGCTSPASTWCATRTATSACSRTTCGSRPASATCWRTGGRWPRCSRGCSPTHRIRPVAGLPAPAARGAARGGPRRASTTPWSSC